VEAVLEAIAGCHAPASFGSGGGGAFVIANTRGGRQLVRLVSGCAAEYRVEKRAAILKPRLETLRSKVGCANLARKDAGAQREHHEGL
jgi:hypothetical protein